jgi:hypothetical protein
VRLVISRYLGGVQNVSGGLPEKAMHLCLNITFRLLVVALFVCFTEM